MAAQCPLPRCGARVHSRARGACGPGRRRGVQRGRRQPQSYDRRFRQHGGHDRRRRGDRAAAGHCRPAGLPRQLRENPQYARLRARVHGGSGHSGSRRSRAARPDAARLPERDLSQRAGAQAIVSHSAAAAHRLAARRRAGRVRTRLGISLTRSSTQMAIRTSDFLVVGGGIVGLTLALDLKRRYSDCSVTLLEKEHACGLHASGRNSGVLHAGFYYSANSLKAQFTRDGNAQLAAYCAERGLPLSRCGKLVVATSEADLNGLVELQRRGNANGVPLEALSAAEVRLLEPRARTYDWALFSPSTATVAPAAVVASLVADALLAGIVILTDVAYRRRGRDGVLTSDGPLAAG